MYNDCTDNNDNNDMNLKDRLDKQALQNDPNETPDPDKPDSQTPGVEHLPPGNGYQVEHLPTEIIKPEIQPLKDSIPDLVKEKKLEDLKMEEPEPSLEDPLPSPEDEFYDFNKDIYGDETSLKSDL